MLNASESQGFEVPTNKERIMFICDAETRQELEKWARKEDRSLSNLVKQIVLSALEKAKEEGKL